ncbi:MAG: ABC transporter substrate-binding protein [Beijerinckiaceae bacterium]
MFNRRMFLTGAASGLALPLLPAAVQAQANLDAMGIAELLPLAQKEGKVMVYAFTSRIARVKPAFEAAYPGVVMQFVDISSTRMIARVVAEQKASVHAVDVLYLSDAPVVFNELIRDRRIERYVPPRLADKVPAELTQPLLAQRLSTKVVMYNEAAHPNGAPISNLWEMTLPAWKGRVVMVDPSQRGDYLDFLTEVVLNADAMAAAYQAQFGKPVQLASGVSNAGEQWVRDLFRNDLILLPNTDAVNKAIGPKAAARPPIGIATYSDRRDNEKEGWALQVAHQVKPAPGIVFPAVLGLAAKAPNPAAARLLIDFLMGDATPDGGPGFAPFAVPGDYASRTDIANHKDAVPLEKLGAWRVDPVKTAAARQKVADLILRLN